VQLSRRHVLAYVAIAALVVAVGVRYVAKPGGEPSAGGERLVLAPVSAEPSVAPTGAAAAASPPTTDLVVYVCGAVKVPGVVHVSAGARVGDALRLAGGPVARADLAAVNLAAKVSDGQQIVVPARGQAGARGVATAAGSSGATATVAPVNINTATADELDALDGVGPSTAKKIIDYRTANGPFKTIDDIKNVPGIGDAKFAAMKTSITV
jgi:competence protein ComEA